MTEPKPACVINGEPWWDFLYEYEMDGATFRFPVCARSKVDADERLRRMSFARHVGQADGVPKRLVSGGFLSPLVVWWRNRSRI